MFITENSENSDEQAAAEEGFDFEKINNVETNKSYEKKQIQDINSLNDFFKVELYDRNFGDRIIALGEKLDPLVVRKIFHKYSEIIDSAQNAFEYFKDNFLQQGAADQKTIDRIRENLFRKGKNLLERFVSKAESGEDVSEDGVLEELENIKTETLLFTSSFKIFKEESKFIDLADIAAMNYDVNFAEKFKNDAKLMGEMEDIYRKNYENYPPKFTARLMRSFQDSLENPSTVLFTLKHKDELAAFCRLDKKTDEDGETKSFYFGSFNVNSSYKQSRLGESLFEAAMMEAGALGVPIEADCDPAAMITKKYIESGFVVTSLYDFEGIPSFHIVFDHSVNNNLESKRLTHEEIAQKATAGTVEGALMIRMYAEKEAPDFSPLQHGYVLTRYFLQEDKKYCVFEKIPAQSEEVLRAA